MTGTGKDGRILKEDVMRYLDMIEGVCACVRVCVRVCVYVCVHMCMCVHVLS